MDVRIMVTHIPGVENEVVDALSRVDRVADYSLKQEYFRRWVEALSLESTVDVFANNTNCKCQRFLALPRRLAERAVALDGLRYSWAGELPYLFPPARLIPRVLQKLRVEEGAAVMVIPEWPSHPWWNLTAWGARRLVRVATSEEVLEKGPSMAARLVKLPPGNILMASLSFGW
jgi:hypothetical protein